LDDQVKKQFASAIQEISAQVTNLKEGKNNPKNYIETNPAHLEIVKSFQEDLEVMSHYQRELVNSQTEIWTEIAKIKEFFAKSNHPSVFF
jgi:hypothetical protein